MGDEERMHQIGEVADVVGLSLRTIRHYEEVGLVPPSGRTAGGFRGGFDGSQDHDLVLRCTRGLPASRIRHVPRILYHWRAIPGSTALERSAKDYAGAWKSSIR